MEYVADRGNPVRGSERTFTVVGATSAVGQVLTRELVGWGHQVRPVARGAGVPLDGRAGLRRALDGADGAFVMVPFDLGAADLHAREDEMTRALADALAETPVRRVVLLSGLNAHLRRGTSFGAALMEERLLEVGVPELVFLRAGWFMENFVNGLAFAEQAPTGTFATPFRGDRAMPMVAAADVGRRAANLLAAQVPGKRVSELHGSADLTFREATAIMAEVAGSPNVAYAQIEYGNALRGMTNAGLPRTFAEAVLETARSFNDDDPWALEPRSAATTSSTTLEQWARQELAATGAGR